MLRLGACVARFGLVEIRTGSYKVARVSLRQVWNHEKTQAFQSLSEPGPIGRQKKKSPLRGLPMLKKACMVGLVSLLLFIPPISATPYQSNGTKPGVGSIEGQVTLAGKPVSVVTVTLTPRTGQRPEPVATSVTDEAGHFKFSGIEPGEYLVDAFAPAFVGADASLYNLARGTRVTVGEGETLKGIDIALARGGVITGRILGANQRPIIDIAVDLTQVDGSGRALPRRVTASDQSMYRTDDTGTYRIYGLPPGRYKVRVGVRAESGAIPYEGGYYRRMFYRDVIDESEAQIVELTEGSEASNIDITAGHFEKTYSVSGRIISSDTGKPLAGTVCGYGAVSESGQYIGTTMVLRMPSAPNGEFHIEGLASGRYAAFVINEGDSSLYCEPAVFEVTDSDLSAIEIRARSGASLSGIIAVEDGARIESVEKLAIDVIITPPALEAFRRDTVRITPDARFSAVGLRPGKAVIAVRGSIGGKNVMLSRIEHDGIEQQFIELRAGETTTGVRLVLSRQSESR